MKFTVGNTHKLLKNYYKDNCHQWRAFIRLENSDHIRPNMLGHLATHCTFYLDEDFTNPVRKVSIKPGDHEVGL